MAIPELIEYRLVYRNGDQRGETLQLQSGETLIGRHERCDLRLNTPDISRRHGVLLLTPNGLFVCDLSSRNGIRINRERIESAKPVELRHRDKLQIGRWKFRVIVKDALSGASIKVNPKTKRKTVTMPPAEVLHELDQIAEELDEEDTVAVEPVRSSKKKQPTPAKRIEQLIEPPAPTPSPIPVANGKEPHPVPKPKFDPKAKREPAKLPDHLRYKLAADSSKAADQALRKMFGP